MIFLFIFKGEPSIPKAAVKIHTLLVTQDNQATNATSMTGNPTMSNFQFFNYPGTEANSKNFHYSQAVKVGRTVKTSGQGGWDADGCIVPDVEKQVAVAFDNVEKALKSVDSQLSWQNVYSVRSYHTNVTETFDVVTKNFKRVIPNHRPIWTCVEVGKLGIKGMRIEIEVEAALPN